MFAPEKKPADLERVCEIVTGQAGMIGKHEHALNELCSEIKGISQRLDQIHERLETQGTSGSPVNPEALPGSARAAVTVAQAPPLVAETRLPTPQPYAGESDKCNAFLLQCSLIFEMQPSQFPTERAKVAYMISLLTGRALEWATAVWQNLLAAHTTAHEFIQALKATFHHPHLTSGVVSPLLRIRQGGRSVADYTIEFRTLAASSGWNAGAQRDAYVQGLSEKLKDELAVREPPEDLESLYSMAIRIDNRLRERRAERAGSYRVEPTCLQRELEREVDQGEPMQLGAAEISGVPQFRSGCFRCGRPGHHQGRCPLNKPKGGGHSREGGRQ